jgi:hypothetical protein
LFNDLADTYEWLKTAINLFMDMEPIV